MSGRKRVLIVDNDEVVLIELERRLEDAGFDTTTTWDIREAVGLLRTHNYDFVLEGDCYCSTNADLLPEQPASTEHLPRFVVLSAGSTTIHDNSLTGNPMTVCKRSPDDELRAINAKSSRAFVERPCVNSPARGSWHR